VKGARTQVGEHRTVNMVACRLSDRSWRPVSPARPSSRPAATVGAGAHGAISRRERRLDSAARPGNGDVPGSASAAVYSYLPAGKHLADQAWLSLNAQQPPERPAFQ
jgi:hypothetical protein